MENRKMSFNDVEFSPLRTLNDFLMESARFQMPNVKDLDKWGRRVYQNLIYYQTNYFLLSLVIYLLVSVIHPLKMLCGTTAIAVALGLFYYVTNAQPSAIEFKKAHPLVGISLILGGGYLIVFLMSSVLVFIYGILLPIVVTFAHASLRLRNLKNKVSNKLDFITARKTPMGLFLESLGLEQDLLVLEQVQQQQQHSS